MIHLYASDARTLLEALDDAEAFRRQQARECPCSDELEPGSCENCELHLNAADEYADLAGVIYDLLQSYEPDTPTWPAIGPGHRHWGRKEETVIVMEGIL